MNMFEHDHSAARGEMNVRQLTVFKHEGALGNAPAHRLFELVEVRRRSDADGPARSFADYDVEVRGEEAPGGVEVQVLL